MTPAALRFPHPAALAMRALAMPRLAKPPPCGILLRVMPEYLPTVPHKRNIEYFKNLLSADPALQRPGVLPELAYSLSEQSWEWKSALRSYDAARIELKIRTPRQVQEENSPFTHCKPRLISWHTNHA